MVEAVAEAVKEPVAMPVNSEIQIDELNLDDIVNLNDFKEVYINDNDIEKNDSDKSDIKKISITNVNENKKKSIVQTVDLSTPDDKNVSQEDVVLNTNDKLKSSIIENYKDKDKKNFKFF